MKNRLNFRDYDPESFFDEMFKENGEVRPGSKVLLKKIDSLSDGELLKRQQAAELALLNMGITFAVYGDESGTEKIFPFDMIPRIVEPDDWTFIENGLKQRINALNQFIDDMYHDQKFVKDNQIPTDLIESCKGFRKNCIGLNPPNGIWCHITGTDIIRDNDGNWLILEDNLRCPSGVSYVLENRQIMKRTFPKVFAESNVRAVDIYPSRLLDNLQSLGTPNNEGLTTVLLTPGAYNSAYFEHSFLAKQMGIELVEGQDLLVKDGFVMMRTTRGLKRVDVIYRRIDDDFLDPKAFRKDSMLGVPGIFEVYKNGNVALANAPGTGVADDKVIYSFVPKMIKYYLGEDAILPNVETYVCWVEKDRKHVLNNLDKLVVKAANESGGYGMLVGPHSTKKEQESFRKLIQANPRNYIAQPTISLSRVPSIVNNEFRGRHVDLRPYVLYGKEIDVIPGGLTRVALKEGSLVVNSSQGGGSKDTWVLSELPQ